jgi:hypothetical protein
VVPHDGIFLGSSTLPGSSDGKMNVQSACALNILYIPSVIPIYFILKEFWYSVQRSKRVVAGEQQ